MKAGIFILSLFLLFITAPALPHSRKRHIHPKRELVTERVVVEIPKVIVWVDGEGNTVSLETIGQPITRTLSEAPTGVTTSQDGSSSTVVKVANAAAVSGGSVARESSQSSIQTAAIAEETVTVTQAAPPVTTTLELSPAPSNSKTVTKDTDPAPASPSPAGDSNAQEQHANSDGDGIGICYSPYNDDGSCKTQSQVDDDFSRLSGYTLIRGYGVDCNQVKHMVAAAKTHHKKLFLGIFDLGNLQNDLQTLVKDVGGSWDLVTAVNIGNELVNSGKAAPQDVVNAVNGARPTLRDAGFNGPVVTVDTFNQIIAHPELCYASDDFCAANCHAFFDPNTNASGAGEFVKAQAERVSAAVGGKRTVITESGWPHQGSPNGKAVPSEKNQQLAIDGLRSAFAGTDGGLYLFSAFDNGWKTDNKYTFGTEKYWGITE